MVRWKCVNASESPNKVFELRMIFVRIVQVLDIRERVTDAT